MVEIPSGYYQQSKLDPKNPGRENRDCIARTAA
jgi:hypothetical protein